MTSLDLEMKHKRISYFHSVGRISDEEYEKWILSEDMNFEPKVITKEELNSNFKGILAGMSNAQWFPVEKNRWEEIIGLLKNIDDKLEAIIKK
jgi:hypothetical protein